MIGIAFWALTIVGCGYAAAAGGKDGRWAALLIVGASLLTIPATRLGASWARTELLILVVDLALLVGLFALSQRSNRFFPLWMTGFHLVAVVTHLASLISPRFAPEIYRAMGSLWAVPMTLSMMWGIHLDRGNAAVLAARHRLRASTGPSQSPIDKPR